MKIKRPRISCGFLVLLLALPPCLLLSSLPAKADGGAPNLVYVAGTTAGVSVIDVAQQKVVRTLSARGPTRSILLSQDGRFLYVTQPTLGRVAILAAGTGQIICRAAVPGSPHCWRSIST